MINQELEHKVITLLSDQLKRFKKLLNSDHATCTEWEVEVVDEEPSVRYGVLNIITHVLKNMGQPDLAYSLQKSMNVSL